MDVEILSRLQFAGTIMFHYLFPPLTIGLGVLMVILEGLWLTTGKAVYESAARFWTKIFALNFALGVASGIVMEFQFGTNWAVYSDFVGDVFGSALAAEGIFAFFLESGFLAVLVFGWDRVSKKVHFLSTCLVSLGSMFSAVWIVVANSWQQTPAGYHIVPRLDRDGQPLVLDGVPQFRAEITDFWALVFNPSSVDRLTHVLIGALIMGSFFMLSVACWYLVKNRHVPFARVCVKTALPVAVIASLLSLVTGHDQANKVAETQPAKLAAYEGHFETGTGDLYLFGWPVEYDEPNEDGAIGEVKYGLAIPKMLSVLINWPAKPMDEAGETPVPGLDKFASEDRPPVWLPFQMYHLMVVLGMVFIALSVVSTVLAFTGQFWKHRWVHWVWVVMVIAPVVANQAGWIAAEVGRQPWIVYPTISDEAKAVLASETGALPQLTPDALLESGETAIAMGTDGITLRGLRVSEALSKNVEAHQVLGSIILFGLIYALLFGVWIFVLNSKIQHGPEDPPDPNAQRARGGKFFETASELTDPSGQSFTETAGDEANPYAGEPSRRQDAPATGAHRGAAVLAEGENREDECESAALRLPASRVAGHPGSDQSGKRGAA
ncbi:MAG: cytochrome ubiquinol oxidase subunit I [Planctomycetota bacterium]